MKPVPEAAFAARCGLCRRLSPACFESEPRRGHRGGSGAAPVIGARLRFDHGRRRDQPQGRIRTRQGTDVQETRLCTCPIERGALDRARAQSLKDSLEARDEAEKPGTPDDQHIAVLEREEQEVVHYFLTRRYKL